MSNRIFLPLHAETDAETAAFLAADPSFGLTSVPAAVQRGLLSLGGPGEHDLAAFWPDGNRGHRAPAGDEQVAAEWAIFAAVSPPVTMVEVAVGFLGHHDLHWRLVDVVQIDGKDVRARAAIERWSILLGLYRGSLPGGRPLRLARQELGHLVIGDSRLTYAAEGPGRVGDRLAFRRLAAPYDEPWTLAPVGWTSRGGLTRGWP